MGLKKRVAVLTAGLSLLISLLVPSLASAQAAAGLNVEISPLPIELNAKPGTSVSADLRVRNSGTTPENLKLVLKTFSAEGLDGHIVLHDPSPADEEVKWVSFDRPNFTAPPGPWQTIKMAINVPPTAAFGYYYAVQIELANQPKAQPGTARLHGAVAIFVLLNAEAKGASKKLQVSSFSTPHHIYEFLPVNFSLRVHNAGNVHAAPHGNIFIKRGRKQIAALPINATEGLVLPGSNRLFTASWNDGFPSYVPKTNPSGDPIKDAKGNTQQQLKWDFAKVSHLRFGHYTANLLLVYNDGQRDIPISGSLSFWVIPWRLILFVILIILAPALLVYLIMRRRFRKRLEQERMKLGHDR